MRVIGYIALAAFVLTIPAANWMIGNLGTVCIPNGPCMVPVGFGVMAPSGVVMIGLALVLRDIVHRQLGIGWAFGAIIVGAGLSAFLAPPSLVIASAAAFLLSELADLGIYTPLYRRRLITAVILSSIVGAFIDSAVFLWLAFGSLEYLPGQVLGKAWMVLAAVPLITAARNFPLKRAIDVLEHSTGKDEG